MANRLWRVHSHRRDADVTRLQPPFWRLDNHVHAAEFTNTLIYSNYMRWPVSKGWAGTYNDPARTSERT